MSESDTPDLKWIGRTLRTVQSEQRALRAVIGPLPSRMTGIEARLGAIEARFSGVEEALNAIQLTLRELADGLTNESAE